jgi:hypothetical protein
VRHRLNLVSVAQSKRRVLVVEPVRELAPRMREIYTRREDTRQPGAPVLRVASPAQPKPVPAAVKETEARVMEMPATRPATPAAPPNVELITNQVIEQIDRRLVAYRERMGRV